MNAINWFEIPTADLSRAVRFYETMLGCKLKREREPFGGGEIAVFVRERPGAVAGALVADPRRRPSADGARVFLDARGDLDGCVARAVEAGGRVLTPRLDIGPPGFIAIIADSEGNTVGLHTPR